MELLQLFKENFLKIFDEYGFLHFCCKNLLKSKEKIYWFDQHHPIKDGIAYYRERAVKIQESVGLDYWWRGYSSFDRVDFKKFTSLFEVLRQFEGDPRFSLHISCLSQYFNIPEEILLNDYLDMKDLKEIESNYTVKRAGKENFRYHAVRRAESNLTEGSQDFSTNQSFSYENNTKLEIFSQNIDRQGIQTMITIKTIWDVDFVKYLSDFDIIVYGKDFPFVKFKE